MTRLNLFHLWRIKLGRSNYNVTKIKWCEIILHKFSCSVPIPIFVLVLIRAPGHQLLIDYFSVMLTKRLYEIYAWKKSNEQATTFLPTITNTEKKIILLRYFDQMNIKTETLTNVCSYNIVYVIVIFVFLVYKPKFSF